MENFIRSKPIALGQYDKGILGVDVDEAAMTLATNDYTEVFVPEDEDFNGMNIMVGDPRPTDADPSSVYQNFLWCDVDPDATGNEAAVILAFNYAGKNSGVAKKAGESLGWFCCPDSAGASVIGWKRN